MQTCLCSPSFEQACAGRQLSQLPAEPTDCISHACNTNLPEEPRDSMEAWLPDEVEAWSPPCRSPMPSLLWSEASTVCRQRQYCFGSQKSLLSCCSMLLSTASSTCTPGCTMSGCTWVHSCLLGPAEGSQQVLHPDNQVACRSSIVGTDCCTSSQTPGSPRSSGSASSGCSSLVPRPWCRRNCACCPYSQYCWCGPAHHLQQCPPCLTSHNWDACPCAPHQLSPAGGAPLPVNHTLHTGQVQRTFSLLSSRKWLSMLAHSACRPLILFIDTAVWCEKHAQQSITLPVA